MTARLTPVLVEIRGIDVSILELAVTRDGFALHPTRSFTRLGRVQEVPPTAITRARWVWVSGGHSGKYATRAAALKAMLANSGYVAVKLTATIPKLF